MTGYSLHIGLNHVDPDAYGGWDGRLSGCVNDANAMQRLASDAGFLTTLLLDEQATSQSVIGEIAWMAGQAVAGDLCLITYSGHGGQVDDANGDEPDGLDETWVCFERQVVDDELAQMWSQFEPGVRVLVVSDSCHSGTVVRARLVTATRAALLQARSRDVVPAAAAHPAAAMSGGPAVATASSPAAAATNGRADMIVTEGPSKAMPLEVQQADNRRRRGTYAFVQWLCGRQASRSTPASVILLAGCQDSQLSYDGPVNGQFTGALLRVWNNGSYTGDYRSFVTAIARVLPPDQVPNFDTAGGFDAAFAAQRPFTVEAPDGAPPSPSNTSSGGTRPTLRRGATGEDVRYLQARLVEWGWSIGIDGSFGPGTEAAVRSFQRDQGLTADGVVGAATWAALG